MKTKLLRKIRKRYDITHYPNGRYLWGEFEKDALTILSDNQDSWRYKISTKDKKEAYDALYEILLKWIEKDYGNLRSKRSKIVEEKLWWKLG